ncbi:hypothetical protein LTS18_001478, partial [Coniosporium uncinatum]
RVQKVTFRQLREMKGAKERKEMEKRHMSERDAEKIERMAKAMESEAAERLVRAHEASNRAMKVEAGVQDEEMGDVLSGEGGGEEDGEEQEESVGEDEDEMDEDTSDGG